METQVVHYAGIAPTAGMKWRIDPVHSTIGFSVRHMMVATVRGHFGGFSGTIRYDSDRPWDSGVDVEIDATTVDTGIRMRDEHLRSTDLFDVATYPTISFRSTSVGPAASGKYKRSLVAGELTMHGVTRAVLLTVEQTGGQAADVIEFEATARIHRRDFGMEFNLAIEDGGLVVSDEVKIAITLKANRITS
jgi:polyisoprenoid-binding protein YceI